jgi:hypothetical protein
MSLSVNQEDDWPVNNVVLKQLQPVAGWHFLLFSALMPSSQ